MVENNCSVPYRFKCVADHPIPGVDVTDSSSVRLDPDKPQGCWVKLDYFRRSVSGSGPCIALDLDTTLIGDIAPLQSGKLALAIDRKGRVNSSVMAWTPHAATEALYTKNIPYTEYPRGDQEYIRDSYPGVTKLAGCYSYKVDLTYGFSEMPEKAIVVYFHGTPTPAAKSVQKHDWNSRTWDGLNRQDREGAPSSEPVIEVIQAGPYHTRKQLRNIERKKYEYLYEHRNNPERMENGRFYYGMGKIRNKNTADVTRFWSGDGLVDVGCGRNEFIDRIKREQQESGKVHISGKMTGVDPTRVLARRGDVLTAFGHELPFPDKSVDFATCWDVIEHLIPGDDMLVLEEMERIARKAIAFSISSKTDSNNLHINLKPQSVWKQVVNQVFEGHRITYHAGPEIRTPVWVINLNAALCTGS